MNNNWSGFVVDGSGQAMQELRNQDWFWKYDLRCLAAFIDRDKGANFIVANKESKSKALLTDRGSWHLQ